MLLKHHLGILLTLLLLGACANTKQTDALVKDHTGLLSKYHIENVPFFEQSENYCGPASLAMVLNYAGKKVEMQELGEQIYTPGSKGTFQTDIIGSVRRQGMMGILIERNITSLLNEISHNHPVLIFQNLTVNWAPSWHYAVAIGYDLAGPDLILHSGPKANQKMDLRRFEYSWEGGGYWGLVVLPPDKLSATGSELAHATAAAGLEQTGKLKAAETAYKTILKKWPESLASLIGMANLRYDEKKYREAEEYLLKATAVHPKSAIAWHNLATVQGTIHKFKEAKESSKKALSLVEAEKVPVFKQSLKTWLDQ